MKKENISLIVSGMAFILSVVAICMAAYRTPELGFDYQGVIVAFLSLVVTFFVAVQIYQSFNLKRDIDRSNNELYDKMKRECESALNTYMANTISLADKLKKETENIISKRIEDYDHTISASVYQVFAQGFMIQHKDKDALECLMKALESLEKATDKTPLEGIISFIDYMKYMQMKPHLTKEEAEKYSCLLGKTGNNKAIRLIAYVQSLSETDI